MGAPYTTYSMGDTSANWSQEPRSTELQIYSPSPLPNEVTPQITLTGVSAPSTPEAHSGSPIDYAELQKYLKSVPGGLKTSKTVQTIYSCIRQYLSSNERKTIDDDDEEALLDRKSCQDNRRAWSAEYTQVLVGNSRARDPILQGIWKSADGEMSSTGTVFRQRNGSETFVIDMNVGRNDLMIWPI